MSRRHALNESGAASTIDPLTGSYYVEALTSRIEEACVKYFQTIDDMGGVIAGIENGYFQKEIAESAFRCQRSLERGERIIVGLNKYNDTDEDTCIPITYDLNSHCSST